MTISADQHLALYNGALRLLKSRRLSSITDDIESRYILDDVWANNAVQYCLESGYWSFAIRTSKLDADPSIAPQFGFPNAFTKPDDYIKLSQIAADEYFSFPLEFYADEQQFWYAAITPIYVQYLSNDTNFGLNYAAWPQSFANLVQAYLAQQACGPITKSDSLQEQVNKAFEAALRDARSKDAMNQPTKFLPLGSWARSRLSRRVYGNVPQGVFSTTGQRDY